MKKCLLILLSALFIVSIGGIAGADILATKDWSNSGNSPVELDYIDFDIIYTTPSPYAIIFDSLQLHDGETGVYTSNAATDSDFSTFANRLTDGVNQMLEFKWTYDWGSGGGSGSYDSGIWSGTPPGGLVGYTIDAVVLDVKTIDFQNTGLGDWPVFGDYSHVATEWEYDIEVRVLGTPAPVPEPSTMFLLGFGLLGIVGFRKKFKNN